LIHNKKKEFAFLIHNKKCDIFVTNVMGLLEEQATCDFIESIRDFIEFPSPLLPLSLECVFIRFGDPPTDGGGLTISGNLKSFAGPVLKCRGSTDRRALYVNELVIHEIRNNASAIFQNFLFICCKIEFVQLWQKSLRPPPSVGGVDRTTKHISGSRLNNLIVSEMEKVESRKSGRHVFRNRL
jgi:hypothetical protein